MKFLNEYRDAELVIKIAAEITRIQTQPWVIMEICGGQTHAIMRYGLDQLLPAQLELVHGPGCPVCVTAIEIIDRALYIASQPDVIFVSFGDMLRVPGSKGDLFTVRAFGGDVRVVYSPLDAIQIAQQNSSKQVVFFAIGFETTAPANAMTVLQAQALQLENFSILTSHVRVPPAISAILSSSNNRVQGFLAAGHVCAVMGYEEYIDLADEFKIPIVVTGFEPLDLLNGILLTIRQLERGSYKVENAYPRAITKEGNRTAQQVIHRVFMECDRNWRGIGKIPMSGWKLRSEYSFYDAENRFAVATIQSNESPICVAGEILQGIKKPFQCNAFATLCTPENPLGATMVSSEGACAAYYRYRLRE
jgi:hydrogenase expression/formation protein HypD